MVTEGGGEGEEDDEEEEEEAVTVRSLPVSGSNVYLVVSDTVIITSLHIPHTMRHPDFIQDILSHSVNICTLLLHP